MLDMINKNTSKIMTEQKAKYQAINCDSLTSQYQAKQEEQNKQENIYKKLSMKNKNLSVQEQK